MPELSCREIFGRKLRDLMRSHSASDKDLQSKLLERGHEYSYSYINRVGNGKIEASEKFVKAVAELFEEDERELLCIAGCPPEDLLLALSSNPHKFLSIVDESASVKVGVVEILWAAHIFAVPRENHDWMGYTQFECLSYETGREALQALLNDEVQFATVTKAAIQYTTGKEEIFPILDFLTPQSGSLYYLYKLPNAQSTKGKPRKYAYLKKSVLEEVANQYVDSRSRADGKILIEGVDSLEELIKALDNKDIHGFFGWPPLNDKVIFKLREMKSIEFENVLLEEEDLAAPPELVPTLYLVTTHSFVKRYGPAIMTDLVSRIIKSRSKINNADDKQDYIWSVLKEYLPYLYEETKAKLLNFAFDANIESEAFKLMISERSHWATTSQRKGR